MVRKIIQPWWIRKQIALTVARIPSWGLRCCRPKEPLSEPRRGEFRRRAANRRANRTGNAACQEIVFESSWRYILHISFLNAHLLALRTRSIPRSKSSVNSDWAFTCFREFNNCYILLLNSLQTPENTGFIAGEFFLRLSLMLYLPIWIYELW